MKRPIKVGKRPSNEGKRPIKAMVLVGISVGCLMGCFRAPPPWRKTAPLKRPIKRSMSSATLLLSSESKCHFRVVIFRRVPFAPLPSLPYPCKAHYISVSAKLASKRCDTLPGTLIHATRHHCAIPHRSKREGACFYAIATPVEPKFRGCKSNP